MRTLFDIEEEEEVQSKASEITLSTASLLGIFFGLVLICGVFFGFGYSMGRGTGQKTQAHALENVPANNPSDGEETASAAPPPEAAPAEPPASAKAAPPAVKDETAPDEATSANPEPLAKR